MSTKTTRQTMKPTKRQTSPLAETQAASHWKRSYESKMETLRRKNVRSEKYKRSEYSEDVSPKQYRKTEVTL